MEHSDKPVNAYPDWQQSTFIPHRSQSKRPPKASRIGRLVEVKVKS
jgi:hypothetical protein